MNRYFWLPHYISVYNKFLVIFPPPLFSHHSFHSFLSLVVLFSFILFLLRRVSFIHLFFSYFFIIVSGMKHFRKKLSPKSVEKRSMFFSNIPNSIFTVQTCQTKRANKYSDQNSTSLSISGFPSGHTFKKGYTFLRKISHFVLCLSNILNETQVVSY